MYMLLKRYFKVMVLAGLVPVLVSCAWAPGMRMDKQYEHDQANSDIAPANFKEITPELLREEKKARESGASQDVSLPPTASLPYCIDRGDILSIVVWAHPELSAPVMTGQVANSSTAFDGGNIPGFVVDQDGLVQFPYVGQVKLAGLTALQARDLLTDKLSRYVNKPDITLRVQAYRSKRIYLDGEVKTPGIQAINDIPMTLREALSRAGGILPSGDKSQIGVRRDGVSYRVDLSQPQQRGMSFDEILLRNDDIVHVFSREDSKVFVLGEVTRPVTLTLRNGRLTLNEALGDAGGLSSLSSDARQVYVIRHARDSESTVPQVYHLDARSPTALALAEHFELNAKDVIYVDTAPLARWARVVSLILPTAQSATNAVQAGK